MTTELSHYPCLFCGKAGYPSACPECVGTESDAVWVGTSYDPPTDAPGEDCPDHGPYADDECPKCDVNWNGGVLP